MAAMTRLSLTLDPMGISHFHLFSSPDPKGQVSYCHHWASVVCPSVNFSHFNQLLWSQWANLNQTLVEWCLDGLLPKLCSVIPTFNQDGRQAKNRKKRRNEDLKKCSPLNLQRQSQPHFAEMIFGWFPSKIVSGISDLRSRWPQQPNLIWHWTVWEIPIKIFLSEKICSIRTICWWNSHWMVLFQNESSGSALRLRWLPQPNLA